MIKYKMLLRIVENDSENKQYLMIFGGSSVTAGHDNLYNSSYPLVIRRRLTPLFNKLGISFKSHNIAQGANDCIPYNLCLESMGNLNPDWIGWEQSYNCGNGKDVHELVGRLALTSKNKAVIYYSASGGFSPSRCNATAIIRPGSIPYNSEKWTPSTATPKIDEWKPTAADVKEEADMLFKYHAAGASAVRFANSWKHNGGAYGFNVWMGNSMCELKNSLGQVLKKGCNGYDIAAKCAGAPDYGMNFMTHEAGVYGVGKGANWHPPQGVHLFRGEAIAWHLGLILLDSVYHLQKEIKNGAKIDTLKNTFKAKLEEIYKPLGSPQSCEKEWHCTERPTCYNSYYPKFSPEQSLQAAIVGKTMWKYSGDEMTEWHSKWGYRDSRPSFYFEYNWIKSNPTINNGIHVKLDIGKNVNEAIICGTSLSGAKFYLDIDGQKDVKAIIPASTPTVVAGTSNHNSTIINEYTPKDRTKLRALHEDGSTEEQKNAKKSACEKLLKLPEGKHVLSIYGDNSTFPKTSLSHIITWV